MSNIAPLKKYFKFTHPGYGRPISFPIHIMVTSEGIYVSILDVSLALNIPNPNKLVHELCPGDTWRCTDRDVLGQLFHEGDGRLKGLTVVPLSCAYAIMNQAPGLDRDRVRGFRAWISQTVQHIQQGKL